MECSDKTNMYINETLPDEWGGEVQLIDVATDLASIMVNVKTPWGDTENFETIYKGIPKTYTSGDKTYIVEMTLAGYVSGKYIGQIIVCYDFTEKVNTTLSMIYDSNASQLVEGGKLFFDILLKDQSGNILENYDVDIYKNGVYEWNVPGDWKYEHVVTADEVGQELIFQAKFDGKTGFNASQSSTVSVLIPGKLGTNLSINVDKATVSLGETISFTGTLKDENDNIVPNQTLYLVYKTASDQYDYVLDNAGYKLICSADSSGNYYRPWEPTEEYLDYDTYAMYFEGTSDYETTYSPDIIFDVTLNECEQNIKIQNQDHMPVEGVTVTIDSVSKTTDVDGLVSFVLVIDTQYVVYKVYGDYSGEDTITSCALNPQILHVVTPVEPTCIDYTTQEECEDGGCYWWESNNTCQSAPEGTTEFIDIHLKPYSWYDGKYEEALSAALTLTTDLTGKIANYMSSVTGYEYNGIEVKEDLNKNVIIIRVFLKDTNEAALVAPAIIVGLGVAIGFILVGIGFIIGTSQGGFSKSDITQLAEDIVRNAEIDAYEHAYVIDKDTATQLMDCLKTIETCDDSLACFEDNGVTPSLSNQMEVLVAYKTIIDSVYTGVADTVDDAEFEIFAAEAIAELEIVIQKLESATITPEGAACETTTVIDDTIEDLDDKQVEQEEDDCVFDIYGECIVTEGALGAIVLIGAGIAALVAYSVIKK